nr:FAD-binding oxidoreductase [uncultured Lichenicoccus sp.]
MDVDRRWVLGTGVAAAATAFVPSRARARSDLSALQRRFQGVLVVPESINYDRERRSFTFNPNADKHPVAIAKCTGEEDVVACLDFAQANGLDVAVRSGGHDILAASTCDGLVIDTRPMASSRLSASGASVAVGAGAKAGEVTSYLQRTGHAVPFGDSVDVGVGGLTLGGGIGLLCGKYGATCDNLIRARLVLADGRRVIASEDENPDLFWAIRGGGGNFGIVTQFEYATQKVGTVLAGYVLYDAKDLAGFLRFYRDYMAVAPDELVIEVDVEPAEKTLINVQLCWSGDVDTGRKVLAPFLSYGPPLAVSVTERPYAQVAYAAPEIRALLRSEPVTLRRTAPHMAQRRGGSFGHVSDAAIHEITERIGTAQGDWRFGILHHLHGAICRVPPGKTALVRPLGSFSYNFISQWINNDETARQMAWVEQSAAALRPYSIGSYVNYLSSSDPQDVRRTYGDNFARLQSVKRRYDPNNILHNNRNIPPAV